MASSSEPTLLPFDLVEEILCRIPVEYLIRLKLVCKQWYSLFKNKRFIYKYSDFVQERFIRIHRMFGIINPMTETRLILPMPDEFGVKPWIYKWPHCDGLLLFKFSYTPKVGRLAIWNPILGQIKWIVPWIDYLYDDTYGFGYGNVSRDDYKILRFREGIYDAVNKSKECYGVTFEIYSIKSNSWRIVDTCFDWTLDPRWKGVSVNGNMYWMARRIADPKKFIQSFDFSTETFKPRSSLPFESSKSDTTALTCFRRDRLCLLQQFSETKKIEVWVSNKVDDEVMSWSKYLSFASPDLPLLNPDVGLARQIPYHPEYFIDKNDNIRILCVDGNDGVFKVYEIGKDGIKEEVERGECGYSTVFFRCYVYVPGLVSLPE